MTPRQQLVTFGTIVTREIRRYMRIWVQTLVPPVITTGLYFVIFGQLIGPRIGPMAGYDYVQFVAPGLIMLAVINSAYANVVSSFFGAKFQRSLEELLVSPTPSYIILSGFVIGGMTRALLVGASVGALTMLFARLPVHSLAVTVLVAAMTALLFSLAGFINGVYANRFDDVSVIPTFVLTPLIYLGGIFYSVELLPDFWATASLANPILYMVNAFRYGLLGISDIDLLVALGMISAFIVAAFLFGLHLLNSGKRLRQ